MNERLLLIPLSILAACIAGTFGIVLTYRVRDLFHRRGFVDRPNEARKQHKKAVPYGGGTAIITSMGIALGGLTAAILLIGYRSVDDIRPLMGLAIASVLMWGVGLYDDLKNMRGVVKLLWQIVAASIVVWGGTGGGLQRVVVFGHEIVLGWLAIPLAIVWILAAINSLNLLDGMDGLAGTVGLLLSITMGLMAMCTNRWLDATVAFALAGALLGFLKLNWPPAQIYMGDSGSMLIGLILGTLAIRCELKDATTVALAAPLAMFAIPLMDSAAAIVRRKFTGRSMYVTDRGHIHHRMLTQGLSNKQTLYRLAGLCSITCFGGFLDVAFRDTPFPFGMVAVGIVVALMLTTQIFGNSELTLLGNRFVGLMRRLFPTATPRKSSVRLQGTLAWEPVWDELLDAAQRFELVHLRLNLHLPDLHEDFYASWRRRSRARTDSRWRVKVPLSHEQQVIGTLLAVGSQPNQTVSSHLVEFSELVTQLEKELGQIIDQARHTKAQVKDTPVAESETASALAGP